MSSICSCSLCSWRMFRSGASVVGELVAFHPFPCFSPRFAEENFLRFTQRQLLQQNEKAGVWCQRP